MSGGRRLVGIVTVAAVTTVVALWITDRHDAAEERGEPVAMRVEADLNVLFADQPYDWTAYALVIPKSARHVPAPPSGFCRTWWA